MVYDPFQFLVGDLRRPERRHHSEAVADGKPDNIGIVGALGQYGLIPFQAPLQPESSGVPWSRIMTICAPQGVEFLARQRPALGRLFRGAVTARQQECEHTQGCRRTCLEAPHAATSGQMPLLPGARIPAGSRAPFNAELKPARAPSLKS